MAGFLNRLFGRVPKDRTPSNPEILRNSPQPEKDIASSPKPGPKNAESDTSQQENLNYSQSDGSLPDQPYFTQMEHLRSGVTEKDYQKAAAAARASLPWVRKWLMDPRGSEDRLELSIPALSQGGTMMAFVGDKDGLMELRKLVQEFDYLEPFKDEAENHFIDMDLFNRIREAITAKPGLLQNRLKTELDVSDGRKISRLVAYLDKAGEIRRAKSGNTYALFMQGADMPDAAAATIYSEPTMPGSHRHEKRAAKAREINLRNVKFVPLPPSPPGWDHSVDLPRSVEDFEDPQGAWAQISVEKIDKENRPDPAFRKHYTTARGSISFDDLAKSKVSLGNAGAVVFSDTAGRMGMPSALVRDAAWISAHPDGEGFASRSRSGVLTVYDGDLDVDFETDLGLAPEVIANAARLDHTGAGAGLRCIALTPDRSRYMFTYIDEAWCISRDGKMVWGVRVPEFEPRTVDLGSIRVGTSSQISDALKTMSLEMPVSHEMIQKRYRELARKTHPDINPGGEEFMKDLNRSYELLTGIDPSELVGSNNASDGSVEVKFTMTYAGYPDRISEIAFSGSGDAALLATSSGRVIRVDGQGIPKVVYEIGAYPHRIIETEAYLYLKTFSRLYVLDNDKLVALEDCPVKCDFLVSKGLLLLVENKGIRVFTEDGRPLGIALTKSPIRRAYIDSTDLVIETRTQRARFSDIKDS
ncbi:DnaJ domain-containing protein [Phaeobacter inhibens]|uniref:DnaJ domain-containing protein n=1 Tax=Phaeobacter inhibens TaxID=221822 RepID=A0A2I7K9P7_9RHOB|nr:DnaJ domain-containing protein [Phaeobacter inhibens]AUQ99317.1 dnaJ domain-containing protein [Phaeobacter inhibens]